jgi:hypothetical protein
MILKIRYYLLDLTFNRHLTPSQYQRLVGVGLLARNLTVGSHIPIGGDTEKTLLFFASA